MQLEQEQIRKNIPQTQQGLTLKEYRQMEYLSKVIDETLRIVNISFVAFRQATTDVMIQGLFATMFFLIKYKYVGSYHPIV